MRWRVWSLFVFSYLASGGTGLATTSQRLSLAQLANEADLVIRGQVQEMKSQESSDRSAITTTVVISVEEQWKGPKRSTLSLKQPGGSVGGITQRVTGLPQFSLGEEVILFLEKQEDGHYVTAGSRQGKFIIKTDSRTGKRMVEDLTGKRQEEESFVRRVREIVGH